MDARAGRSALGRRLIEDSPESLRLDIEFPLHAANSSTRFSSSFEIALNPLKKLLSTLSYSTLSTPPLKFLVEKTVVFPMCRIWRIAQSLEQRMKSPLP